MWFACIICGCQHSLHRLSKTGRSHRSTALFQLCCHVHFTRFSMLRGLQFSTRWFADEVQSDKGYPLTALLLPFQYSLSRNSLHADYWHDGQLIKNLRPLITIRYANSYALDFLRTCQQCFPGTHTHISFFSKYKCHSTTPVWVCCMSWQTVVIVYANNHPGLIGMPRHCPMFKNHWVWLRYPVQGLLLSEQISVSQACWEAQEVEEDNQGSSARMRRSKKEKNFHHHSNKCRHPVRSTRMTQLDD